MKRTVQVYASGASATPAPVAGPATELDQTFAWKAHRPEPQISEQLAQEIREALVAAERGETVDLGSFAQFADEPED
jgi:hypothetical protein